MLSLLKMLGLLETASIGSLFLFIPALEKGGNQHLLSAYSTPGSTQDISSNLHYKQVR